MKIFKNQPFIHGKNIEMGLNFQIFWKSCQITSFFEGEIFLNMGKGVSALGLHTQSKNNSSSPWGLYH